MGLEGELKPNENLRVLSLLLDGSMVVVPGVV